MKNLTEFWWFIKPGWMLKLINTWKYLLYSRYILKNSGRYFLNSKIKIKNENEKVSIVIPTLSSGEQSDHFPKLKRLLCRYLPEQTYSNYEAIVYCDGPNKKVEEMVSALDDDRVSVYHTKKTFGAWGHPQTRLGINMSKGDFFVRMNDDNILEN
jgi:cellulose synthase/poly-beta-1,6-N-acetylglucosamine synthase-like glycosyltransferase